MKHLFIAVITMLAIGCTSSRHSTAHSATLQTSAASTSGDGSSYEKAIVIKEKSEGAGVSAEYQWIREHYPGSKTGSQALQNVKGKSYDVLTITTADGVEKKIYFDISNFFGKF